MGDSENRLLLLGSKDVAKAVTPLQTLVAELLQALTFDSPSMSEELRREYFDGRIV